MCSVQSAVCSVQCVKLSILCKVCSAKCVVSIVFVLPIPMEGLGRLGTMNILDRLVTPPLQKIYQIYSAVLYMEKEERMAVRCSLQCSAVQVHMNDTRPLGTGSAQ